MRKFLSVFATIFVVLLLTGGFLVWQRFSQNVEQIFPYPYSFSATRENEKPDAPIVLVGDRMGNNLSRFIPQLSEAISVNLDKPIKIQNLTADGQSLPRTLHLLKHLVPWPQIVIYHGGSEESREKKFEISEIPKIRENLDRYHNEVIETFLILYPWLSRIVYEPVKKVQLPEKPAVMENISQKDYLARLETELLLFEQQLIQMVEMSKNRNSLLILTTTPINLDIPPKETCEFSSNLEIEKKILELREYLRKNDLKSAYQESSEAKRRYLGNARLLYIHGQISRRLGKLDEGRKVLLEASAYDCIPWRASAVHNSIIRKVARDHQVLLFDFALLVEKDWVQNITFFDEIHPQNLYYEKAMSQLGQVIRKILKL
jgi:hypothetical protein